MSWNPSKYRHRLPSRCFLARKERKYPICNSSGNVTCKGLIAAYSRASLERKGAKNTKSRTMGRKVRESAKRKRKSLGCKHRSSRIDRIGLEKKRRRDALNRRSRKRKSKRRSRKKSKRRSRKKSKRRSRKRKSKRRSRKKKSKRRSRKRRSKRRSRKRRR